jgi:CAAX protease family protein
MGFGQTPESTSTPPPDVPASGEQSQQAHEAHARPPWPASAGLAGLLFGTLATIVLIMLVGGLYVAAGFDDPADAASFEFVAIATQSLALVAVTLVITSRIMQPRAFHFGFRRPRGPVLGPTLTVFFGYLAVAYAYALLASPPEDDLPQELGADESTSLAIITGIFVIAIAPLVEEFFFRGFLYQAFRNRIGVWAAAGASGLIFGAIHFKPEFLVPLAALGILLAWLFEKTGSLWPCIAVHAVNNTLAFAFLL